MWSLIMVFGTPDGRMAYLISVTDTPFSTL